MKTNQNRFILFILQASILLLFSSCSHVQKSEVSHSFSVATNVPEDQTTIDQVEFEAFDDLNLGFFKGSVWIRLDIQNNQQPASFMVINNDLIHRNYVFFKLDSADRSLKHVNEVADYTKQDHRTFNLPNPNFKIDLEPHERATYIIKTTSDGRTLDATPQLIPMSSYYKLTNENMVWSIVFFGILGCLLIINIYQWTIHKQQIYFYYIFYLLATFLMYMGLEGQLHQLELKHLTVDHIVFLLIRLWALSLIMYTSKFLEIQTVAPKYYQFVKWLLLIVLGGSTLYQFLFYDSSIPHLHYSENVLSFLWLLIILGIVLLSAKTRKLELKYYLIPLLCFIVFTGIGLIDGHFQILPGTPFVYIKLGTIIEFIGFTYFMAVLIRRKLLRTEKLETELIEASEELKEKEKLLAQNKSIQKTDLISIFKLVENSLSSETEWDEFKQKFKEINPKFLNLLLADHPKLTKSEIRLLTLVKIGYSTKEIANILYIAPDSVKKASHRARKKMNLSEDIRLKEYLNKY